MEVDVPGHTASIAQLYSEHVACLDRNNEWPKYAAEPPTGQLRLGNPETTQFTRRIISSIARMLSSPYMSTGGDEVNRKCYQDDSASETSGKSDSEIDSLLSDFVSDIHDSLRKESKTPVVWEEMAIHHNVSLSSDTIVKVWRSSANARAVADRKFRIIHAASDFLYLDCGLGAWLGALPNGGNSWCDPFKSWAKIYSFDPSANLTSEQHKLVLGGETLLWTEQADSTNLDHLIWPRAAAAAEVFWTGRAHTGGKALNASEALPRLHDWRYRAVARGVRAAPLQPHYCALRPHLCDARG